MMTSRFTDAPAPARVTIQSKALWLLCLMATLTLICSTNVQGSTETQTSPSVQTTLAKEGQATQRIIIAANASKSVQSSAKTLASYLQQITGGVFEVVTKGDGKEGIAVGLVSDFPALKLDQTFTIDDPAAQEQYLLRSHAQGLYVIGQSDTAVSHAVWDLLYQLGHRQFFPGQAWEIIPDQSDLSLAINALESPDYLHRKIWYGYGLWGYNSQPYLDWLERNRLPGSFALNTGHAYGNVIREFKEEFDKHPEYYALVDGERKGSKMCASNPGVQNIVLQYAKNYFKTKPHADCISIDPTDGPNWCECDQCAKIGSISDRALFLANIISKYLEENLPGKYVAMYAYSEHSPPPTTIEARERVIINVATSFLRGGFTATELIDAWRSKGVRQLGIREYYSVFPWDRDLPGRARGSNIDYLARTIPDFHQRGVRYVTAEASDNWGPNGLGYYLTSRMLWDVDQAKQLATLKQDFYDKAFGDAASTMQKFYELIDGSQRPVLSSPLLGRMYRLLGQARQQTSDARVLARIDQLIQYARYVELYQQYSAATGKDRQQAFEEVIRHGYRMRETMMVHAKGLYRDADRRDGKVTIPKEAQWNVGEPENPWKNSEPFSREQLDQWVREGDVKHPALAFEPVTYDGELVRASDYLNIPKLPPLKGPVQSRGRMTYHLWADSAPMTFTLQATGGMIPHYRDRGPTELRLYADLVDPGALIGEHDVANDGKPYPVTFKVKDKGLLVLTVSDKSDRSQVVFPEALTPTVEAGSDNPMHFDARFQGYFYVPKGVAIVGGYAHSSGATVHDGEGREVLKLSRRGYFHVPVGPGQDGRFWSIRNHSGSLMLMTVPPYLSGSAQTLLLPEAILRKDAGR